MNKEYNLKLDLQFRCNNSKMIFDEFDENTSDFFMQINRQGEKVDISNAIPTLLVLKPGGTAVSQILNIKDNLIYGNLKNSLKNEVGTYIAKLMLIEGDKKTFISNISYEVTENALLGKIDNDIVEDERYSVLLQLLERLSNIELQEQTRIDNESSRIEAENLREESIEKIKNDIDFLVNETNKKVNDNLNTNTSKIDNLVTKTKEELNEYKNNKDIAINEHIEAKELELDNYVEAKNKEIDNYKTSKSNEIDLYMSEKNTLINSKISEVDSAKEQLQNSVNSKLVEVDNAEKQRQEEHLELVNELSSYSSDMNNVKDRVEVLEAKITDNEVIVDLKNKVNNHEERISTSEKTIRYQGILLNALNDLDDTITIENEEGTVISLPQSDNGKIIIDELEGNTLVNYVTDGSKELTLNGDIEVEGTNVTLTDTVDNGKVNVVFEGNTLVNLFDKNIPFTRGKHQNIEGSNLYHQKEIPMATNGTFHIIAPIGDKSSNSSDARLMIFKYNKTNNTGTVVRDYANNGNPSLNLVVSLTREEVLLFNCWNITDNNFNKNYPTMMVLEGDWTNKETPQYFEGMKSVGELEDNKIEILSQSSYPNLIKKSKNLSENEFDSDSSNYNGVQYLIEDNVEFARVSANKQDFSNFYWLLPTVEPRKKGETYTISCDYRCISDWSGYWYPSEAYNGNFFPSTNGEWRRMKITRTVTGGDTKGSMLFGVSIRGAEIGDYIDIKNVKMEKGTNNSKWIPSVMDEEFLLSKYSNKKEISLNEPLRGLLNGVKDKIVKIDGKWYIQRNTGQILLNGDSNEKWVFEPDWTSNSGELSRFLISIPSQKYILWHDLMCESKNYSINNRFNALENIAETFALEVEHFTGWDLGKFVLNIKTSRLSIKNESGLKQWLSENPIELVYELETPTYEEIPIDPTINTYTDITHISNNSTIPCNMKVTNTGYNAIIKPSTQYTVAFDTNTSGEVNIGLGGAKTSTTNGVATITTPNTLTDDTLRLYGKGIKASNVRLLEGDKTNYMPSFFEGMKSCFEENLQEDESYKVEIISSNLDNSKSNKLQLQLNEPLRAVGDIKDKLVFEDNKLMVKRNCGIREYQEGDFELDNTLTDKTNTTYILNEPTYEEVPYETQKLILECFENGTLFIDTVIPPIVSVTYSANKPVVVKLNQVDNATNVNTEDIAITQMAVDFLLMSSLGEEMINFKVKGGTNMSAYFASRIIKGALKYEDVVKKYPQYKEDIDLILISEGYSDLIVEL